MIKLSPLAIKSLSGIALSVLLTVLPSTTQGWTLVKEEQLTRHQTAVERRMHEQATMEKEIEVKYVRNETELQETMENIPKNSSGNVFQGKNAGDVCQASQNHALYSVDGDTLDPEIAAYLYARLEEQGIPQFMDYAVLIAYQESGFNSLAENPNGRDKGLFQYRIEYFPGLDWTDPFAEIDIFAVQMGNRARAGKTVAEMISAHMMSDYGEYCQEYVDAVMGHSLERK